MGERTSGVFLFTDLVGSTRLWEQHSKAMEADLARHDELIRTVSADHGGAEYSTAGDSFGMAFASAKEAVAAAVTVQRKLARQEWSVPGGLRVRLGIHLGTAQRRSGGWYGPPLNEAARIMSVAHGGQIVVSEPVAALLPAEQVVDLGTHRLRDIDGERRLYQVVADGLPSEFPPLRSIGRQLSTLPAQRTTLIGRHTHVDRIDAAVADHRLVTVVGPGGMGKTRAAIEAAGRAIGRFPAGVFFVDLTRLTDDRGVAAAFVDGIGRAAPPGSTAAEHLVAELAERQALLVVDNCEHVIDAVAEVIESVLTAAPWVHVLATSREVLGVAGEHVVVLPGLGTDGPGSPAARLFIERALDADSTVDFGEAELAAVAEIVQRLDGMPLAIELAAARTRSMRPGQILAHLDDRFGILVGARRADPRQRTLETTIAWSYDLLDVDEQRALRALAVCAGPVTLETTARLLGLDELTALQRLDTLVAKSLVVPVVADGRVNGYRLLETIRAFGRRRSAALGEVHRMQTALEHALLPPLDEIDDDFFGFLNSRCNWTANSLLEATTRGDAATQALEQGRLDAAAYLVLAATTPTDPGGHGRMLSNARRLVEHGDELRDSAQVAARTAKMALETFTNRYLDTFETAREAQWRLGRGDPRCRIFDAWRLMIVSTATIDEVVEETNELLPLAIAQATPPHDVATSMMAIARAVGLYLATGDAADARQAGLLAAAWAEPGTAVHSLAVSWLAWLGYLEDTESERSPSTARADALPDNGMPDVAIAQTLADQATTDARAHRLVRLARSRPLGRWIHEESTFLVPFAWLAIEQGELERAASLLDACATVEIATATGLIKALQRLEECQTGEPVNLWAIAPRLMDRDPEHLRRAPSVLAAELERWDATPPPA